MPNGDAYGLSRVSFNLTVFTAGEPLLCIIMTFLFLVFKTATAIL
jgi:hypothetical protein